MIEILASVCEIYKKKKNSVGLYRLSKTIQYIGVKNSRKN